jgi:hypothetical protein
MKLAMAFGSENNWLRQVGTAGNCDVFSRKMASWAKHSLSQRLRRIVLMFAKVRPFLKELREKRKAIYFVVEGHPRIEAGARTFCKDRVAMRELGQERAHLSLVVALRLYLRPGAFFASGWV